MNLLKAFIQTNKVETTVAAKKVFLH